MSPFLLLKAYLAIAIISIAPKLIALVQYSNKITQELRSARNGAHDEEMSIQFPVQITMLVKGKNTCN